MVKKSTPPPMDEEKCHFGHWIKEEGYTHHHLHPQFENLVETHRYLHVLGRELVDLYKRGEHGEVKRRQVELMKTYKKQIEKVG